MNGHDELDAILADFVQEKAPDLAAWSARHPALARDFARVLTDRRFGVADAPASLEGRVAATALGVLRERRATQTAFSLKAAGESVGLDADALSEALQIPVGLFWKLQRRLIAPTSLPGGFVARVAEVVRRTEDEILAFLRQPPALAAGASYRADAAPTVGEQQAFSAALDEDPDATDAMRQAWGDR